MDGASVGLDQTGVVSRFEENLEYPFISILEVSSVTTTDLGVYSCSAVNEMGAANTMFNLTVKSESRFTLDEAISSRSVNVVGVRVGRVGRLTDGGKINSPTNSKTAKNRS